MTASKHYCRDCANLAYGYCAIHKAKVNGKSYSDCTQFIQADRTDSITTQIERRKEAENSLRARKENLLLEQSIIRKTKVKNSREQIKSKNHAKNDVKRKAHYKKDDLRNIKITTPKRLPVHDKWLKAAQDKMSALEKEKRDKEFDNKLSLLSSEKPVRIVSTTHPSPSGSWVPPQKKDEKVYALSVQDEALLDRFIKVDNERRLLIDKLSLVEEKLRAIYHFAIMNLDPYSEQKSTISDLISELLEIIQKDEK